MTGLLARPAASAPGPVLRVATPADGARVRAFLAGLSLDSAYRRFFTGLGAPSSTLVRWLVEVDHVRREVLLAVHADEVVGLADVTLLAEPPAGAGGSTVELGVVVADAWQRQGLGPRLASAVLALARARGAERLRVHSLAENQRVARLLHRTWPAAVPSRDGTILVWDLPLP